MHTDNHGFSGQYSELTSEILGSAFEVLNTLGTGLLEKPYGNALAIELESRGVMVDQQRQFPVLYKRQQVGLYRPDLIADRKVLIDTKIIDKITNIERAQMLNYLRVSKLEIGLILNFKYSKLEYERFILNNWGIPKF